MASSPCPSAAERAVAARSRTTRTFLNCAASVRHGDTCVAARSSFGPCDWSRLSASAEVRPRSEVLHVLRTAGTSRVCHEVELGDGTKRAVRCGCFESERKVAADFGAARPWRSLEEAIGGFPTGPEKRVPTTGPAHFREH
jgi:hypothetical protein